VCWLTQAGAHTKRNISKVFCRLHLVSQSANVPLGEGLHPTVHHVPPARMQYGTPPAGALFALSAATNKLCAFWLCVCCLQYEPELFPGLIYRMKDPKIVLLIFVSGKVVLTGELWWLGFSLGAHVKQGMWLL
jgi:hypothetical protein